MTDPLVFLVEFAQRDLEALSPRDWLALREQLTDFLGSKSPDGTRTRLSARPRKWIEARAVKRPFPWAYPEEAFRTLQHDVLGLLRRAVDGRGPVAKLAAEETAMGACHQPGTERKALEIFGSVRTAVLFVTLMELTRRKGAPIRRCPECDRLFYRIRKQKYCTRACVNAANMRAWLKTPKGQSHLKRKYDAGGWQRGTRPRRASDHGNQRRRRSGLRPPRT